jgi:PAS domain S-box-containing protein
VKRNLTLAQKGFLLVAVPLVFELTCVGVLVAVWQDARQQAERERQDREIVAEVNNIMRSTMLTANTALLNNVFADQSVQEEKRRGLDEIKAHFANLDNLVRNHPLRNSVARASAHLRQIVLLSKGFAGLSELDQPSKLGFLGSIQREMAAYKREITGVLDALALREKALEEEEAKSQQRISMILLTLVVSSIALAVGLATYFNTQAARRLAIVMKSIGRLSAGQYGSPPLAGEDEFSALDRDIHKMAARLLEANRKEMAVVENAQDVIFSINKKGHFTAVNPAATRAWKYSPEELAEMKVGELLVDKNRAEVLKQLEQAAVNQKPCTLEVETAAADGAMIEQLWSVSWSEPEETLFCVAHDIAERKRIERVKQDFVAMITHDLRTPLTSIRVMLSLLVDRCAELPAEWRDKIKHSEESADRLISLINDLLDLEKMQAGKLLIDPDLCLIDDLVEASITSVQAFADSRKIKISYAKSTLLVVADERRLVQVIVNLLSNAIKFSPGGSMISITSRPQAEFVELRISDQGRGIPADKLQTIFNRFEQVSAADESKKGGTGLGLAICHEVIKAHSGQIGVESQEGAGSTFWIRLPSAR